MRVIDSQTVKEQFEGQILNIISNNYDTITKEPFAVRIVKFIDRLSNEDDFSSRVYMRNKLKKVTEILNGALPEEYVKNNIDIDSIDIDMDDLTITNVDLPPELNTKRAIVKYMKEEIYYTLKNSLKNKDIKNIFYIVQQPIPKRLTDVIKYHGVDSIDEFIYPEYDIDCTSPENFGRFILNPLNRDLFMPCTVRGIYEYLRLFSELRDCDSVMDYGNGRKAVIIGRSNIVGKPTLHLLSALGYTVLQCHSKTSIYELTSQCRSSDLIISAVGKEKLIDQRFIDVYKTYYSDAGYLDIIDVGINRDSEGKLCGDVSKELYDNGIDNIFITPVPKGVGVLTTIGFVNNLIYLVIEKNK